MEQNSNIILFPEYEKLKKEVEKLRTELSMMVLERDELRFVECKNIEMDYMLKLGALEYKAYKAQCNMLRLKRKVELIQAKKNRQEKINISQIDELLDDEFVDYQRELEKRIDKMNDALYRSKEEVLSDEQAKEINKLYRKIVKTLHPDLNPNLTEGQLNLFQNAVTAYENGDLQALQIIAEMISAEVSDSESEDTMKQLTEEKKRLLNLLNRIKDNIMKIKSEFPYIAKEFLMDAELVEAEKKKLEEIISQFEEATAIYRTRIKEMLR